jgi:hypothetical protein
MPAQQTLARKSKRSSRLRWPALLALLVLSSPSPLATATFEDASTMPSMRTETPLRPEGAPRTGKILKEIVKQAVEQPGHLLIAAAPIWLSRSLVGVPWYGWAAAPLLIYREWRQWPSKRWWDPPLDWAFLTIGAVLATWSRRLAHIGSSLPPSIRQVTGRALAQCSRRIRIPPTTRTMPAISMRFGRSWNRKIEAAKVNSSSIWPSART